MQAQQVPFPAKLNTELLADAAGAAVTPNQVLCTDLDNAPIGIADCCYASLSLHGFSFVLSESSCLGFA